MTTRTAPPLTLSDAVPARGPIPADALAFANALLARTEQTGMCLASVRSPSDDGAEVILLCATFEAEGLRRSGHRVTTG